MLLTFEAVEILEDGRIRRNIRDVEAAARWLLEKWPGDRDGKRYKAALKACHDAIEGVVKPANVRAALVIAARAEGILLES
jgi:hypothetical protein